MGEVAAGGRNEEGANLALAVAGGGANTAPAPVLFPNVNAARVLGAAEMCFVARCFLAARNNVQKE